MKCKLINAVSSSNENSNSLCERDRVALSGERMSECTAQP